MTFSIKLPNMVAFKAYAIDLLERVGSTFAESVLAGVTMGVATGADWWETAGVTALFALAKGILAYFVPAIGNLKTAGLLSWIISAIVKSPNASAVVTVTNPVVAAQVTTPIVQTVIADAEQDITKMPTGTQIEGQILDAITKLPLNIPGVEGSSGVDK